MDWNAEVAIYDGATGPDPRTTPLLVTADSVFHLPPFDRRGRVPNVITIGFDAPPIDTTEFALWVLDSRDNRDPFGAALATDRWYRLFLVSKVGFIRGGETAKTRLNQAFQGAIGGGLFYFQAILPSLSAASRTILIRASS